MRTTLFSYVSENQFRCTPSNYAGVCLQNTYDYSPFGVSLDGRTVESDFYRHGFNGMEKDDEFKGKGNSYTTEFRQYDPRLGRWLSIDSKCSKHPDLTPYISFINNPIFFTDPFGDDPPEGFKNVSGQGGNLSVPESTKLNYSSHGTGQNEPTPIGLERTRQEITEERLESFEIAGIKYSAQFTSGDFSGYYNGGGERYENPDVQISSSKTFTDAHGTSLSTSDELYYIQGLPTLVLGVDVTNLPCDGLQIIQTVQVIGNKSAGLSNVKNKPSPTQANFVDFGANSPGGDPSGNGIYYTPEYQQKIPGNYSWNGKSGFEIMFDQPLTTYSYKNIQFETIVVAKNYMNSGKDLIVGSFQWGYNNFGSNKTGAASGKILFQPIISNESIDIIKFDYPNYEIFK